MITLLKTVRPKANRSGWALPACVLANPVCRLLLAVLLLTAHCSLHTGVAHGQQVIDKMVATVNASVLPDCRQTCLITYSDLLWQLALQPNTPLALPWP